MEALNSTTPVARVRRTVHDLIDELRSSSDPLSHAKREWGDSNSTSADCVLGLQREGLLSLLWSLAEPLARSGERYKNTSGSSNVVRLYCGRSGVPSNVLMRQRNNL